MASVLVGVSGGVDSATSCLILKENGYDVAGCNINFIDKDNKEMVDAIKVCESLNIKYYHINYYNEFKDTVIKNFVDSYKNGSTPNPCILCNKHFKFGLMLKFAKDNGFDYIATGHYARIMFSKEYNRYIIRKAKNLKKDQSYFLYSIPKEALPHIIFPLQDFDTKDDVRKNALNANLSVANKKDSLDVCFIPNKDYKSFLINNNYVKPKQGNIVLKDGTILGKHDGLFRYTIGQRKGLGISYKEPLYVIGFNILKNELIVGIESELYKKEIIVSDVNLLLFDDIEDGLCVNTRIRYQGSDNKSYLYKLSDGKIKVLFENPQKSPTKGQSAVFYIDDILVGGGIIE